MFTLNCRGHALVIDEPLVMGILNATPDSFFSGSRQTQVDQALQTASTMLEAGARLLDIGGQSTRPGSERLSAVTEIERIIPIITAINQRFPNAFLSVDTYHAEVAKAAVEAGASLVNDISGGLFDANMLAAVALLKVPYVCMHVKGNTTTLHQSHSYDNVTMEVLDDLRARLEQCEKAGILDVIVDPGLGFSKTISHNFQLLKELEVFHILQKPILIGVSRKSTIYKTLGITPEQALNGTTVLHTAALLKGAHILRVHDVPQAIEAIRLTKYLQ